MYQIISDLAEKVFSQSQIFRYGFNLSPMYIRSTGKIVFVSEDLLEVNIKIPRTWRNKNYVGSIFGGSLFSATDPIYMIQLFRVLGKDYVVWDKASKIRFKRPAFKDAFVSFKFSIDEINHIKKELKHKGEIDYVKSLEIKDKDGVVFCTLEKTLYVANKSFYKQKLKDKNEAKSK